MNVFRNRLAQYATLSDDVWKSVDGMPTQRKSYEAGEDIIRTGERTDQLFIIEEGWCTRYRLLEDGRRQIVNFMLPGDIFDLQCLVSLDADHSVTTLTRTEIRTVAPSDFMAAIQGSAIVAASFWWAAVQEESILREQIVRIGRRSARERIGHLLLELRRRHNAAMGESGDRFEFPISRMEVADALGLTHVHVSRTMSAMRRSGLIAEDNGCITIVNRRRLERLSQFDPDYLHLRKLDFTSG